MRHTELPCLRTVVLLDGAPRIALLAVIWSLALAGAGWISLILLPQIWQALFLQPVLLMIAGGVLYALGALIYAFRRPNPLPRVFGFHELFHLLVIAGIVAITATIWMWVVPFR